MSQPEVLPPPPMGRSSLVASREPEPDLSPEVLRKSVQSKRQVARRLKAILRLLLQTVAHDLLKRYRDAGLLQIDFRRALQQHCGDRVYLGLAAKCSASGQHFVKNRAHAEDVTAVVHCLAPQLLG